MESLDEVIKCLKICVKPDIHRNCKDCTYPDDEQCMGALMSDALAYLQEHRSETYCEHQSTGAILHIRSMIPAEEWEKCADLMLKMIKADVQIKIDELLRNYEQAYGFEPVTIIEAEPFLRENLYDVMPYLDMGNQIQVRGYKIYKKRIR